MARTRLVKPEFFTNHELAAAEFSSGLPLRVAFAGLWCHADREGRFEWQPPRLKLGILPFDTVDFAAVLDQLVAAGFVVRYAVAGKCYGLIPTFRKHQHIHPREAQSALPAPVDSVSTGNGNTGTFPDKAVIRSETAPPGLAHSGTSKPDSASASASDTDSASASTAKAETPPTDTARKDRKAEPLEPMAHAPPVRLEPPANEARLRELLPEGCHHALRSVLLATGRSADGAARAMLGMLGEPGFISAGPNMGHVTPDELAVALVHLDASPQKAWHTPFVNRVVLGLRSRHAKTVSRETTIPGTAPAIAPRLEA